MTQSYSPLPVAKEDRFMPLYRHPCVIFVTLCGTLGLWLQAQAGAPSDLHVVQRFEFSQAKKLLFKEQRDIYVQGQKLMLRNSKQWLLIRPDLNQAWLLDDNRQVLAEVAISQLRTQLTDTLGQALPKDGLPPIQPTKETRTLQGLTCQLYRASTPILQVEACVTRQLPALERLQGIFGNQPDIPGVPLDFRITIQPPNQPGPYLIRQSLSQVSTSRLDPALFAAPAPPAAAATTAR